MRRDASSLLGLVGMALGIGMVALVPIALVLYVLAGRDDAPHLAGEEPVAAGALPIRVVNAADLPPSQPGAGDLEPLVDPPVELPPTEIWASGSIGTPGQIVIPRIDVDAPVVSVRLVRGEWPVPRFIVGHLAETAAPGEIGNAVFAGHIQSLTLGNVFARLKEMQVGDEILVRGHAGARRFIVSSSRLVRNTDVSVIPGQPGRATVTLITCEGRWLPREKDYDQRRVVVADAA